VVDSTVLILRDTFSDDIKRRWNPRYPALPFLPELVVAVASVDVRVVACSVWHVTGASINLVEDRGFNIQSASAAQQKRHPVTHVSDERFSPCVERSTRRPAFGERRQLALLQVGLSDDSDVEQLR
jgi:hypothetical protein